MANEVSVSVQPTEGGFWTFIQRSAGTLPKDPLHIVLKWLLEQLNFGNFESQRDSDGALVSMTIGKSAAPEDVSEDDVLEHAMRRLRAVNFTGVMAQGRESGIPPALVQFSKFAAQQSTDWGQRNTEFH